MTSEPIEGLLQMKLTPEELNKINRIPSLVKLCKTVLEMTEQGIAKESIPTQLQAMEFLFRDTQEPPKFKLIIQ